MKTVLTPGLWGPIGLSNMKMKYFWAAFLICLGLLGKNLNLAAAPDEATTETEAQQTTGKPKTEYKKKDRPIEIGDKLRIKIYPEDEFIKSTDTEVSSEGSVTLPLLGKVNVQGLKTIDAVREIVQVLAADYLVNPVVVIEVAEEVTEREKRSVAILGQVTKPGTYNFPPEQKLTLLRVISMAGGFSDIANVKKIKVIRKENGKTRIVQANAESIIAGKDPDIELEPGDVINVGESFF